MISVNILYTRNGQIWVRIEAVIVRTKVEIQKHMKKVRELLCYDDKCPEKVEFCKWYVNEKSLNDQTPLCAAAEAGHTDMAQYLLECGAEVHALPDIKYTVLHLGQH